MELLKHTPGPWTHRNGRIFQADREQLTIANVARSADGDYSPANGILIAAAPDLLEALKLIITWNRDHARDQYGDPNKAEAWSCVRCARAAIAKATGGAA